MRDHVQAIADDEFKQKVEALMVELSIKDISLKHENKRYWEEITTHKYEFDR